MQCCGSGSVAAGFHDLSAGPSKWSLTGGEALGRWVKEGLSVQAFVVSKMQSCAKAGISILQKTEIFQQFFFFLNLIK